MKLFLREPCLFLIRSNLILYTHLMSHRIGKQENNQHNKFTFLAWFQVLLGEGGPQTLEHARDFPLI